MRGFKIRAARRRDRTPIRRLVWKVGINPFGLDWRNFLVAVDETGALLGCGQLKPHGPRSVELASIAVTEAVRGRGIARTLIESLLEKAPRPLYLICLPKMKVFYEPFGFLADPPGRLPSHFAAISRAARLIRLFHRSHSPVVMRLD
ncbi:MAG TPA: GNAT family N-acetyltransferase [Spirochaetia bacterium]|nr:GNAT family N-acetyltransferase [Spirochaetia bacterium]